MKQLRKKNRVGTWLIDAYQESAFSNVKQIRTERRIPDNRGSRGAISAIKYESLPIPSSIRIELIAAISATASGFDSDNKLIIC